MLFSRRNVNMAVDDVDFISMSRNGQLTGFCNALPNFIWKLREHAYATLKRNTYVLFSSPACSIYMFRSGPKLSGTQYFVTHCQKWLKEWHVLKPGTPEHRNTGTLEHWNTGQQEHRNTGTQEHRNTEALWNTLEHPRTPEQPKNPGTPNLTMLFWFPITDHVKNKMSM